MERIGFIGLGVMGRPMALHLLRAGHPLTVFARRPEAARPLSEAGAAVAASPRELAQVSDVVFTMVTNSPDVEQVVLGPEGVLHGARPGSVVVDCSTIAPGATRRVAQRLQECGVEMLDAPVSGGGTGAEQATLSIMVGGKPEVFERVKPLFQRLGRTIVHIGGNGAGQVAKAVNQLILITTIEACAEGLALARRCGVDAGKVREALMGGFAASRVLEMLGKRMVEGDFEPGIEARWHWKDLHIVLGLAGEAGLAVPAAAIAAQNYNALMSAGGARRDTAMLIRVLEQESAPPSGSASLENLE
ncbi:MAG TPA: NAD(P)-dependent oxidoreductase [Burkholderiales bacterium]